MAADSGIAINTLLARKRYDVLYLCGAFNARGWSPGIVTLGGATASCSISRWSAR
jgi:hypothetical protein